jgi:hypothetical protein
MGVDTQALRFLLRSRAAVSFENFLMLGRQWRHVSLIELERQLRQEQFPPAEVQSALEAARSSKFMEPVLEWLGCGKVESLDFSDYEGATFVHDMNQPIPESLKGRYSCVLDGGTLEHIFNFPQAIKNAMEMVKVGGHFLGFGPANNFTGHGFYQFSPELYWRIFSMDNGYAVEEMIVCETRPHSTSYLIDDPAKMGRRIEFTNDRSTYLMVRARRVAESEIFAVVPQQSDYAATWSPKADGNSGHRRQTLRDRAKRLPEPIKKLLRPLWPAIRPLRYSGFKKI